jgi:hypothetical protein
MPRMTKTQRNQERARKYAALFPHIEDVNGVVGPTVEALVVYECNGRQAAVDLKAHHVWPEGMKPPTDAELRTDWIAPVVHWYRAAGHRCSISHVGQWECPDERLYDFGEIRIDGNSRRFWTCIENYGNGRIGIQGVGQTLSADTGEFYVLANDEETTGVRPSAADGDGWGPMEVVTFPPAAPKLTKEAFPVAWAFRQAEPYGFLSDADPRIRYVHPETGERLAYPEWEKAKAARFVHLGADTRAATALPWFIVERAVEETRAQIDAEIQSVTVDFEKIDRGEKMLDEFQDALGAWGRVRAELLDGYPLGREYLGTNGLDPVDVLQLLEQNGLGVGVELEASSES